MLAPKLANTAVLSKDAARANLSKETAEHYSSVPLEYRMKLGQFYTAKHLVEKMLSTIHIPKDSRILEPSFGSGDMIRTLLENGYTNITGVEFDSKFFTPENIQKYKSMGVEIVNGDATKYEPAEPFDLVFSNPPYERDLYAKILIHCINITKPGGLLSFLIPTTLLITPSFQKYRDKIHKLCNIERVYVHDKRDEFLGANVEIMIFQLRKTTPTMDFCKVVNKHLVFVTEKNKDTPAEFVSKTITDRDCKYISELMNTTRGKLSPAQIKASSVETKSANDIPIIFNGNIRNNKLNFTDKIRGRGGIRKNFMPKKAFPALIQKAPFIAIASVIGFFETKTFECAIVREGEYYVDKTTIIGTAKNITDLERVYATLISKEFYDEYIKTYTGRSIPNNYFLKACLND